MVLTVLFPMFFTLQFRMAVLSSTAVTFPEWLRSKLGTADSSMPNSSLRKLNPDILPNPLKKV